MGGMGEEEIVIMYHYIEDKVFLKDLKYLCSYNIVTVEGAAASRVFFHLKAEAVRMGE